MVSQLTICHIGKIRSYGITIGFIRLHRYIINIPLSRFYIETEDLKSQPHENKRIPDEIAG